MTQVWEHVEFLSREIGARTPGTEEERQAALYIADQFELDSGFQTEIEDIASSSNLDIVRPLCGVVMVVASLLALIVPFLAIPALILGLIAAAVYITEMLGKPIIPQSFARGASQNVVAKYQPNPVSGGRRRSRKLIFVARYDSGRVRPGLAGMIQSLRFPVGMISVAAMGLAALLLLIRTLFMANATGVGSLVFNIINIIVLVVVAAPAVAGFLTLRARLNEGANNNATGVAALLEVARRISRGAVSDDEAAAAGVRMHGENALRDEELVPEGAQMLYESEQLVPPSLEPQTPEERLAKAKAALAAFTGASESRWEPSDISSKLVDTRHGFAEPPAYESYPAADQGVSEMQADVAENAAPGETAVAFAPIEQDAAPVAADSPDIEKPSNVVYLENARTDSVAGASKDGAAAADGYENAPDWFVAAQKKARKTEDDQEIRPSRYGSAIAAAERDIQQRVQEEEEREREAMAERDRIQLREALAVLSAAEAGQNESDEAVDAPDGADGTDGNDATEVVADDASALQSGPEEQADSFAKPAMVLENVYAIAPDRPAANVPVADETAPSTDDTAMADAAAPAAQAVDAPVVEPEAGKRADGLRYDAPAEVAAYDAAAAYEPVPAYEQAPAYDSAPVEEPAPAPRRRPIVLPHVGKTDEIVPIETASRQRAPLGDAAEAPYQDDGPSRSGMIRQLRTDIPSLSGSVAKTGDSARDEKSAWPAYGVAGATGSFAPVSQKLMDEAAEDDRDMYIDDADETGYEDTYTETGAYAGPGYVDMPKSRFGGLFKRKNKNKDKDKNRSARSTRSSRRSQMDESPQEWLGVDDDFDPRRVGKERGGWESFRSDDYDDLPREERQTSSRRSSYQPQSYDDYDDEYGSGFDDDWEEETPRGGRRWQGGAFSRLKLGRVQTRSGVEDEAEPASYREGDDRAPVLADFEPAEEAVERDDRDIEEIHRFRNPNFETEVWFVAIGSDTDRHDGMRAFIDEHRSELRGSLIVEVESLGAGELSIIKEEGLMKRVTASSRTRRLIKKTAAAIGFEPAQATIPNTDSLAAVATTSGFQAMHLAGMDGMWPSLKGSADDSMENIDEELLLENIDYLTELAQRF